MELVSNFSFVESAAKELVSPKPCAYNNHEICTPNLTQGNPSPA